MPQGWYRHYCLFIVFLVVTLAYADRAILSVVIEAVKHDFGLSDLQMGLLAGPAFALFYAILGVPLARWSDMGNRRVVITVCLAMWSLMTALGGLCQNFVQLFLTRIGVGIGEAGAAPPTHSLVSDYYPARQHGKAASVLMFAASVGGLLGFALGGYLLVKYDWRIALFALGLPGLAVAALAHFSLREPRTQTRIPHPSEILDHEARGIIVGLWQQKTFRHIALSMAVFAFFTQGVGSFVVPFFIRSLGVAEAEIGAKFGLAYAASALLGTLLAAVFVDLLQRRNVAWLQRFPALCCALAFPCYATTFMATDFNSSLWAVFLASSLIGVAGPAIFATLYAVVHSSQRAMAVALIGLVANLIGAGIGPVAVGAISDALHASLGAESLRYTLAGFSALTLWASLHMVIASRSLANDYLGQRPDLIKSQQSAIIDTP